MESTEFKFTLDVNETNIVLRALGKGPYDEVVQLIAKIQSQAQSQIDEASANRQAEE